MKSKKEEERKEEKKKRKKKKKEKSKRYGSMGFYAVVWILNGFLYTSKEAMIFV